MNNIQNMHNIPNSENPQNQKNTVSSENTAYSGTAAGSLLSSDLKIHHIGYLVKKMEDAIHAFRCLGYTVRQETAYDGIRRIHICFMEKDGYLIELVSPAESDSLVSGLLKKYKNSPYHICYETQDLDKELALLTAGGYTAIDTPPPAPALNGRRVVFLMNPFLGMIELLEHN